MTLIFSQLIMILKPVSTFYVSLMTYRKSLINSPWAINFLTQGLLLVRAPGFIFNKPHGFLGILSLKAHSGFLCGIFEKKEIKAK